MNRVLPLVLALAGFGVGLGLYAVRTRSGAFSASPATLASGKAKVGELAPELAKVERWANSAPLTLAGLKGKVVLMEFWAVW